MSQTALDFAPRPAPTTKPETKPRPLTFEEFHAQNPHVYRELVRLAREARAAGRKRVGIGELYEVARWHLSMRTDGDAFKLNNSHRAPYARLIMTLEPDLAGIFETRKRRCE